MAISGQHGRFIVIAGIGLYQDTEGQMAEEALPPNVYHALLATVERKHGAFLDEAYLGYCQPKNGSEHVIYLNIAVAAEHRISNSAKF